jgi:signal transduction histidine kinase
MLLALLLAASAQAQPRIDSLTAALVRADDTERVDLLNDLAGEHLGADAEAALRTGHDAFEEAVALGYAGGEAEALLLIGRAQHRLGRFAAALQSYRQAEATYETLGDVRGLGTCHHRRALVHEQLGQADRAATAFALALRHLDRAGAWPEWAQAHTNAGLFHWRRGDFAEALPHYQKALDVAEAHADTSEIGRSLNNIGVIYYQWGRYEKALDAYGRSLALRKAQGNTRGVGLLLNNIGMTYQDWGKLDTAHKVYLDAYDQVEALGNDMVVGYTLNNLGTIYRLRGAHDQALAYYQRSLQVYDAIEHEGGRIMNLIDLGQLHAAQNQFGEALDVFQRALAEAQAEAIRQQEATALSQIGQVYHRLGRHQEALTYYQRSLTVSQALRKRSLIKDIHQHLSTVYEDLGNYEQALAHRDAYHALQDSLFTERSQELLADMEAQYEAEKIETENAMLRAAHQRTQIAIALISLLLLVGVGSAAVLYRSNRHKREANRLLAASNAQVARQRDDQKVLVHILSHDLANVLGNVRNCMNLMTETPSLLPELGPMAQTVTRRGIDVIALVREMRALEDGETLDLEPVPLRAAVEEAALVLRDQLVDKDITLRNEVPPALTVVAERVSLIISVLANVLTNAIKFSPHGQLVRVRARPVNGGDAVEISVRDYGIGMSAEIQKHLFDLGRSTSRPGTAGEKGNGFGMPLVKRFVKQYGGHITVHSHEREEAPDDAGTDIRIVLAAAAPVEVETSTADAPQSWAVTEQD